MVVARQSTARTVMVGPVLDANGAAVTDCVIGDLKISKNGGNPAAFDASATLTHRHTGYYSLAFTANDLDTVGQSEVVIDDTVNAMPIKTITVLEEAVYDALFAAGATGALPVSAGGIAAAAFAAGAIDAAAIANGAIDAATFAADVDAEILSYLVDDATRIDASALNTLSSHDPGAVLGTSTLTQTQVTGGAYALNSASFAFNAALDLTTTQKASVNTEADTALSDYGALKPTTPGRTLDVTAGGNAGIDWANVEAPTTTLALTGTTVGTVTTLTNAPTGMALEATSQAILADTNELQTDWANGGRLDNILDAILVDTGTDIPALIADTPTVAEFEARTLVAAAYATAANQATIAAYIDTEVAAIKAKTDNLPADPADASDIAASFASIASTLATISAFLDTEIAAILEDTGTTLPAQIAALNNLSAAQVKTQVVDALATDTYAEPAAVPAATASLKDKIGWLAMLARNKLTQTAALQAVRDDGDTTNVATAAVADDGTTTTRDRWE